MWVAQLPCLLAAVVTASMGQPGASEPAISAAQDYQRTMGQERVVFEIGNKGAVYNSPKAATRFSLEQACLITFVENYHWNHGKGKSPGTIGLRHDDGTMYGPWTAAGRAGQGGVPNAYWIVQPNVVVRPGTYTIVDSDSASWAQNSQSQGRGFTQIKGIFRTDGGTGLVTVPSVVGITHQAAHARLQGVGLILQHPGEPPPDTLVKSQSPAAGARVKKGSSVTVAFNLAATVPDLVGMPHDFAHKMVESLGLVLNHPGDPSGKAKVVHQRPAPGTKTNPGSVVAVVFQETVVVPYLRGVDHAAAHQLVEKLGLTLGHGAEPDAKEVVKTQDPPAGTETTPGANVRVTFAPLSEIIAEDLAKADAKSGDVQISLHWTNKSDLDLHVVSPSGETIFYGHRKSKCGGELDVDRNAQYSSATAGAVENVYWPKGKAPGGKYKVYVDFYSNHGNRSGCTDPSSFSVRVVTQGSERVLQGAVGSKANRKVLVHEFELSPGADIAVAKVKLAPPGQGAVAQANFGYRGNVVIQGDVVPELTAELRFSIKGNALTGTLDAKPICETNRRLFGAFANLTATLPPGATWESPGPITGFISGDVVGCPGKMPIPKGSTFTLAMTGKTVVLTTTGLYYNHYQFGPPMGLVTTVGGTGGGTDGGKMSGMLVDFSNVSKEIQQAFGHVPPEVIRRSSGVVILRINETHRYSIQTPGVVRDANGIPTSSFSVLDRGPPSVESSVGIVDMRVVSNSELELTGKSPGYAQVTFRQPFRFRFSDGTTTALTAPGHFFVVVKAADPDAEPEATLPKVSIRGKVIRRDTNKPVAGALIQLVGDRGKGAGYPRQMGPWKTDSNGEFAIEAVHQVPEGQFEIFLLRFNPDPDAPKMKDAYEQDLWPVKFYLINITKDGAERGTYDVGTIVMDTVENLWGSFLKKTNGTGRQGTEWRGGSPPQGGFLAPQRRGDSHPADLLQHGDGLKRTMQLIGYPANCQRSGLVKTPLVAL